jgi:hypothetical protein
MARSSWALGALLVGVAVSQAAPLEDATLRPDGEGFRLMGRLLLEDGLYAIAEARYGKAFDARAPLEGRVIHQEVEGRPPPIPGLHIELEATREPPTERLPEPDLTLPGPRVSSGWLSGPSGVSVPGRAPELRFEPPTGPEGTGLAPPAPGIDLENPRGIREGAPRLRGERDLSPIVLEIEGVGTATLRTDFDQRQVQQRALAPNLSQPFLLEVSRGDASWRFRYDSGLEQWDASAPTEDGVSQPVLAAWGRRDAEALAETRFFQAVRDLLQSDVPLASRTQLVMEDLRFAGKTVPLKGKLHYLPGPPKSGKLSVRLTRRDFQALPELVEDRGSRGAVGTKVLARALGSGSPQRFEATVDAEGLASIALEAPGPRRLRVEVTGTQGPRAFTFAAWRWGRAEEAWLDSGRPPLPALAAGTPEKDRLEILLKRILDAYSPDDGNFHGPGGSSGIGADLLLDVVGPALDAVGSEFSAEEAEALAALKREVAEARKDAANESASYTVLDPRVAPGSGASLKALSGGLEMARHELGQLSEGSWTMGLAAAAAKLATRLAQDDAGPGAALLKGGTRELLDALKARADGEVHRASVMTKAGPAPGRAFPEDEWAARLYLALAFRAGAKSFPEAGFAEAATAQVERLKKATRPSQAFPEAWRGKGLGTVARVLDALVREYGEASLAEELSAVRAELWGTVSGWKAPERLTDWVDALQGWL